VGISYRITCDRCGAQYPEEIASQISAGSSFGMSLDDVAWKIRDNFWLITIDHKVLCPICNVTKDFDADEVDYDSNAWHRKGLELGKSGHYEEALQAFDKALELNSDVSTAWYNKGIALDNLGRYEEALQVYNKALELKSEDSDTWHRKGGTLDNS
jgi:tetratricopeptide (TPR) repeat protein